jgi:CheY-like chemotaxis protein
MSYPLMLQPLVIEDNDDVKDAYEGIFETISAEFRASVPFGIMHPCYAFSYDAAVKHLEGSKIFQVVILDLRLPEAQGLPEVQDQDLGLALLEKCIERDRYPIPALLVISGHVGSTDQVRIQDTLRDNFFYGKLLQKGDYGFLEKEIRRACHEALRYAGVGLHLRDAGLDQYPTLNPREEDLLRRSVLQQSGGIGADLNWWSASRSPQASAGTTSNPWTKVLMGRYLLDDGGGASRPKFFKLLAGPDSRSAIDSARKIEQKLTHIKLTSSVVSRSTGLIVTEKVGAQDARPNPLGEIFQKINPVSAFEISGQIVGQVQQLGELLDDSKPLKSLLWPAHDETNLTDQWRAVQQLLPDNLPVSDPLALYAELRQGEEKVRLRVQPIVHGDLHINNVALDDTPKGPEAYIFDAGVIRRSAAGRDIAVLEVSILLHQHLAPEIFKNICALIYDAAKPLDADTLASVDDPKAQNIIEFIRGLREGVKTWNQPEVYALLVFDFVLIQLGGLMFGTSGNRLVDSGAVGILSAYAAGWYKNLKKRELSENDLTR